MINVKGSFIVVSLRCEWEGNVFGFCFKEI